LVLGAWCLVLGAWCLVLGAWCLVLGAWCLVLGAWFAKGEELRAKLPRSSLNTRRSQEREKLSGVSKNYQPEPAFVDH